MLPKLIVHGGAWNIPDAMNAAHIAGVEKAIADVFPQMEAGMNALDAVEAAVNVLEADPTFDAGKGAFLNEKGEIELDAIIMDGRTLHFGAVAALQNILYPVSVARQVMMQTEHCFLVGKGAQVFAKHAGFTELPPESLLTERELALFQQIKNDPNFHTRQPFDAHPKGTVGAVAMDLQGNLAAATSTGGTPRKMQGRVGDTPLAGAGAYADNESGAASATGWGEAIMKILLTKIVCDNLQSLPPQDAANKAIHLLKTRVNGLGGVIAINNKGEYAFAHNTPKMAFAFADSGDKIISGIKVS